MIAYRARPLTVVRAAGRRAGAQSYLRAGADGGEVAVPVETGADGGVGGGGGRVKPDRLISRSTRSRGPPGALCCCAVCASASDGARPSNAAAEMARLIFGIIDVSL